MLHKSLAALAIIAIVGLSFTPLAVTYAGPEGDNGAPPASDRGMVKPEHMKKGYRGEPGMETPADEEASPGAADETEGRHSKRGHRGTPGAEGSY